ncbi:MAG TPA: DUF58 domain-containing protein [Actinomycetota bacterium]|nr:DUF58 domain-containing protein [Actinomycetota bacterium]
MTVTRARAPERAPDRPGPGALPDVLLRRLNVKVRRRIDGLIPGDFLSMLLGAGTEIAQIRRYEPGDDVRRIDWSVTARMQEPHVRLQVAERALTTWMVIDTSASMTFGTQERRKLDVAEGVLLAVSHLATRGGNRLGIMTFGGDGSVTVPPSRERIGPLHVLKKLRTEQATEGSPSSSMLETLDRAARICRSRGVVVVVSDFRGPHNFKRPLSRLAQRHHVLAVEVVDPREQELVDVGTVWMTDIETGRQLRVDTHSDRLRARFASAAEKERAEVRRLIRGCGCDHVVLSTEGDWLRRFADHLVKRHIRR